MTRPLSAKQILFCQGVAAGLTLTQAYIDAGYSKKGADGAACKLQGNARIKAHIADLQQPAADAIRFTAERAHEELFNIGTSPEIAPGDRIRAIAEYNKMVGGYEAEKIEVKSGLMIMLDRIRDSQEIKRVKEER